MRLEELPVEVLVSIFVSTSSLADLESFANTFRRIYSIFQNNKASLIYQFLANKLGPVIADLLGVCDIEALDESSPTYIDQLGEVLSTYSTYLANQHNRPVPGRVPAVDHVLRLARSYHYMVPVADVYLTCTFNLIDIEIRGSCPPTSLPTLLSPISNTERLRVLRAHFGLHMMLHAWDVLDGRRRIPDIDRINMRLFAHWEPWELQQIFCVGSLYEKLHDYLDSDKPPSCHVDSRPREVVTSRVCEFEAFWGFVAQFRTMGAEWQETVNFASKFVTGPGDAGEEEEVEVHRYRHKLNSCSRTTGIAERHRFPVSLRFDGDHVGTMPFAWVDAFGGHYGYNFLDRPANIRLREKPTLGLWTRVGFVMWDEPRVEALKTSSILSDCTTGWARSGMD